MPQNHLDHCAGFMLRLISKQGQPVSFRDLVSLIALPCSKSLAIDYSDHEDKTQETVSEEISGIWNSLEIK